ncbi:MAG: translation elongation factor Ts [Nitrospirae bacterium]|nr:translation elongation factor Ts [Nitrospirota bacterium]
MAVGTEAVKVLREKTGAGIMDCKKALAEVGGDLEKAIDLLRQKGLATAARKAARATNEGLIGSYIHAGGKIGVLVEVSCETDFVARTDEFKVLVKDLSIHVAAANPLYLRREEVPPSLIEKEREIYRAQAQESGKPEKVWEKIVDGKLEKFYEDVCLLEQVFVRDEEGKLRVQTLITQAVARLGENIAIRRFVRYQLGG